MTDVLLRPVEHSDEAEFTALARKSTELHGSWVLTPTTPEGFANYVEGFEGTSSVGYLICLRGTAEIVGFVNVNGVVGFPYQRGILGYGIFQPHARRGYMRQALRQVIEICFTRFGLHRIEADIQPGNQASVGLVQSLGFAYEGLSPGFISIDGEWRDHGRWALIRT